MAKTGLIPGSFQGDARLPGVRRMLALAAGSAHVGSIRGRIATPPRHPPPRHSPPRHSPPRHRPPRHRRHATYHRVLLKIVRDIFGNPFRPVSVDAAWLVWNGSRIPNLARTIYDGRRFDDLRMLADALEEAGCTDEQILSHCRMAGPHVRGCWVIDLMLAKQ
jgi:hypothetical protein